MKHENSKLRIQLKKHINFDQIGEYDLNRLLQRSPIDYSDFLSGTRKQHVIFYKHVGMALMFGSGITSTLIAEIMNVDHSSVIHATKKVINMLEVKDKAYMKCLDILLRDTVGYSRKNEDSNNNLILSNLTLEKLIFKKLKTTA